MCVCYKVFFSVSRFDMFSWPSPKSVLATSFYSRKGEASVHERAIRKGLFDDVLYSWGNVPSWEFP